MKSLNMIVMGLLIGGALMTGHADAAPAQVIGKAAQAIIKSATKGASKSAARAGASAAERNVGSGARAAGGIYGGVSLPKEREIPVDNVLDAYMKSGGRYDSQDDKRRQTPPSYNYMPRR